jgi:hypothetical protein
MESMELQKKVDDLLEENAKLKRAIVDMYYESGVHNSFGQCIWCRQYEGHSEHCEGKAAMRLVYDDEEG